MFSFLAHFLTTETAALYNYGAVNRLLATVRVRMMISVLLSLVMAMI